MTSLVQLIWQAHEFYKMTRLKSSKTACILLLLVHELCCLEDGRPGEDEYYLADHVVHGETRGQAKRAPSYNNDFPQTRQSRSKNHILADDLSWKPQDMGGYRNSNPKTHKRHEYPKLSPLEGYELEQALARYKSGMVNDNTAKMNDNGGMVSNNRGMVNDNRGMVNDNRGTVNDKSGMVKDNTAKMNDNGGMVSNNRGMVNDNRGMVNDNRGTVNDKSGMVNDNTAKMNDNGGMVSNNRGMVNDNRGMVNDNSRMVNDNRGMVDDNKGMLSNNRGMLNEKRGMVSNNRGMLNDNGGMVNVNRGMVNDNRVKMNNNGGMASNNRGMFNDQSGMVNDNKGMLSNNKGIMNDNSGMLINNRGMVDDNKGMLSNNNGIMNDNRGMLVDKARMRSDYRARMQSQKKKGPSVKRNHNQGYRLEKSLRNIAGKRNLGKNSDRADLPRQKRHINTPKYQKVNNWYKRPSEETINSGGNGINRKNVTVSELINILDNLQKATKGKNGNKQSKERTEDKINAKLSEQATKGKKATKQSKLTEEKKAYKQSKQIEDKKATKKSKQIEDKKDTKQSKQIENKKDTKQSNQIEDKKASKQSKQIEDNKATKQSKQIEDKKATKQSKQIEDMKATKQSKQIEDKKAAKPSELTIKDKKSTQQSEKATKETTTNYNNVMKGTPTIKGKEDSTYEDKKLREPWAKKHNFIKSLESSNNDKQNKKTTFPLIKKIVHAIFKNKAAQIKTPNSYKVSVTAPKKNTVIGAISQLSLPTTTQSVTQDVRRTISLDDTVAPHVMLFGHIKGMPSLYVDRRVWWGVCIGSAIISMLCCCCCFCRGIVTYIKSRNCQAVHHISKMCGFVDDAGPINLSLMKNGKKKGSYVISILDESKEAQGWSSEEEVFNVSEARNRTSTPKSTPVKTKTTILQ
ncbi:probable serine/threonine-protein kinase tsuA isoform X5 [Dreissena polymorpha]|nr:probable serine/threonine-protein kinase tsuA isoform X1 [Dreissena polymorpha]XP_052219437.1 probable serine/threonine-protein kinase tsuA isoform X2 [Dreissena polymorpha]XP_052219438.1 probable serine/threonine-protein kinase tsuA isoform X3 [Dreissena polymorpha]XP_052219440.1 probable serine/threonine-protein kinase tsuA isoform X5 [Dreissena polymorpha]